eukprot:g12532.t1
MAILLRKAVGVRTEKSALDAGHRLIAQLPVEETGDPVASSARIESRLAEMPGSLQRSVLMTRLRDACDHVRSRRTSKGLSEHLKYLAELAAERLHESFALVRTITWAVPIIGFLGTVIGITLAISNLTPEQLDTSLNAVTSGLGVAFDTTALALALSVAMVFTSFLVERSEQNVLARVEDFGIKRIAGLFPTAVEARTPLADAEAHAAKQLIEKTESLIEHQTQIWQSALESTRESWLATLTGQKEDFDSALQSGMRATLADHAEQLNMVRDGFLEAFREATGELRDGISESRNVQREMQESFRERMDDLWSRVQNDVGKLQAEQQAGIDRLTQAVSERVALASPTVDPIPNKQPIPESFPVEKPPQKAQVSAKPNRPRRPRTVHIPAPHRHSRTVETPDDPNPALRRTLARLTAERNRRLGLANQAQGQLRITERDARRLRQVLQSSTVRKQTSSQRIISLKKKAELSAQDIRNAELEKVALRREIQRQREDYARASSEFSIVPFEGSTGTTRRPIFIECTSRAYRFLPEDITLTAADIRGFSADYNPLLTATRSLIDYWGAKHRESGDEPEPYVMLLVRPSGGTSYYVARRLLQNLGHPIGYELIDDDMKLALPKVDPKAQVVCQVGIRKAFHQRQRMAQSLTGGNEQPETRGRSIRFHRGTGRIEVIDPDQDGRSASGTGNGTRVPRPEEMREPLPIPPSPVASQPVPQPRPVLPVRADPELLTRIDRLEFEIATLEKNTASIDAHISQLDRERARLRQSMRVADSEIKDRDTKAAQLETQLARLNIQLESDRKELKALRLQYDEARRRPKKTQVIRHKLTPVSRVVKGKEIHFRLFGRKVAYVPIEKLVEMMRKDVIEQKDWLLKFRRHRGEVGPLGGFSMKYIVERKQTSSIDQLRNGGYGRVSIVLSEWQVVPSPELPAESADDALQVGSAFVRELRSIDPSTTLTFWVYPDSYPLFRKLQAFAHREGFTVAARPLPFGVPIAGSPRGTRSAGQ